MQVRAIEFQENFARVPVEGARQQSLMQRGPDMAQQQAAQVGADEQALNLSRARPTPQAEGNIVDPEARGFVERQPRGPLRNRASRAPEGSREAHRGRDGISGTRIDVVA